MLVRVDMIVSVDDNMKFNEIEAVIEDSLMEWADMDVHEFIEIEEI